MSEENQTDYTTESKHEYPVQRYIPRRGIRTLPEDEEVLSTDLVYIKDMGEILDRYNTELRDVYERYVDQERENYNTSITQIRKETIYALKSAKRTRILILYVYLIVLVFLFSTHPVYKEVFSNAKTYVSGLFTPESTPSEGRTEEEKSEVR